MLGAKKLFNLFSLVVSLLAVFQLRVWASVSPHTWPNSRGSAQNEWLVLVKSNQNDRGPQGLRRLFSSSNFPSQPNGGDPSIEQIEPLLSVSRKYRENRKISQEENATWVWIVFRKPITVVDQINKLEQWKKSFLLKYEPNQIVNKMRPPELSLYHFLADDSELQRVQSSSQIEDQYFGKQWWIFNTGQIDPPMPGQSNPPAGTPGADLDVMPLWEKNIFGKTSAGESILVAVIDTGLDLTHPDLKHAVFENPGESGSFANNKKDDDGNGKIDDRFGWNFISNSNNPMDDDAHGTHVSGIIAAKHNTVGIAGIAPEVKILPVKFLDSKGSGTLKGAIEAIDYASRMGAQVLNNSWGGVEYSASLEDVIQVAGERGSLFVAAAGNDSKDIDSLPVYPAAYELPNMLTVAATSSRDNFAFFTNTGARRVHVAAPGFHILSSVPGGKWEYMSGTSMACPTVAAVAALVWSVNPTLSLGEVKKRVIQSSDLISSLRGRTISWGRVNATRALFGPFNGQPNSDLLPWQEIPYGLESPHPYLPNSKTRYRIEIPGAKAIKIHMKEHWVEESFDFLRLLDADGNEIQDFYGTKKNIWSKPVRSSLVFLELESDDSQEKYGFSIDKIAVAYSEEW